MSVSVRIRVKVRMPIQKVMDIISISTHTLVTTFCTYMDCLMSTFTKIKLNIKN